MFQKVDKAHLTKQRWRKGASSSTRYLRVKPTQMYPKIEQQKSQPDQQETISGIGRGRPTQQFIAQPIARLNTKSLSVSLPTLFRRPIESNHYEQQPLRAALATFGAPRRSEDAADSQLRRKLILLALIEGVAGAVTRWPSTGKPWFRLFCLGSDRRSKKVAGSGAST